MLQNFLRTDNNSISSQTKQFYFHNDIFANFTKTELLENSPVQEAQQQNQSNGSSIFKNFENEYLIKNLDASSLKKNERRKQQQRIPPVIKNLQMTFDQISVKKNLKINSEASAAEYHLSKKNYYDTVSNNKVKNKFKALTPNMVCKTLNDKTRASQSQKMKQQVKNQNSYQTIFQKTHYPVISKQDKILPKNQTTKLEPEGKENINPGTKQQQLKGKNTKEHLQNIKCLYQNLNQSNITIKEKIYSKLLKHNLPKVEKKPNNLHKKVKSHILVL